MLSFCSSCTISPEKRLKVRGMRTLGLTWQQQQQQQQQMMGQLGRRMHKAAKVASISCC
jgi:hypothetical protein